MIEPTAIKPRLTLVQFYLSKKEYDLAESEILSMIESNPKDMDLYTILGNFYFYRQKREKARAVIERQFRWSPKTSNFIWLRPASMMPGVNFKKH